MADKKREFCWECGKERERCRVVSKDENGILQWVCPQCYKLLDMDTFVNKDEKHVQT